jgi:hypothetical protein
MLLKEALLKSKYAKDAPAQLNARKQQLEALLTCAEDAYELASNFTTAHWVMRLLKRSDYTKYFAALNSRLTLCHDSGSVKALEAQAQRLEYGSMGSRGRPCRPRNTLLRAAAR